MSIVIPVHNEELALASNLNQIIEGLSKRAWLDWELIVVENGSRDRTVQIGQEIAARCPRMRLIELPGAGYGAAMQLGFLEATGDVIVNFDLDFWDLEFLDVATHVMQVKYDILIASKNLLLSKDRRAFRRKVVSYGFRMILFFVFGLRVSDTHGIKAWRNSDEMRRHFRESAPSHHAYDTEIIVRAMRAGAQVLEVPIVVTETRETDRGIFHRIPRALLEIWTLRRRLP